MDQENQGNSAGLAVAGATAAHESLMSVAKGIANDPASVAAVEAGAKMVSKGLVVGGVVIGAFEGGTYGAVKEGIAGTAGYIAGVGFGVVTSESGVGLALAPTVGFTVDRATEAGIDAAAKAFNTPDDPYQAAMRAYQKGIIPLTQVASLRPKPAGRLT